MQYSIVVMSCDKYEPCWKVFFTLLDKYWEQHPKVYLVTESKKCEYCDTINVDSSVWSVRFREALKKIDSDYVLTMLDDFFIRDCVDTKRIDNIRFDNDTVCYNFELEYREPALRLNEWDIQKNNQVYLTSTQPSLWCKEKLIDLINTDMSPWDFELRVIDSPYKFYINNQDFIIDIGYRHQPLTEGWGVTRGKITKECIKFLESEGINDFDYNTFITNVDK